MDTQNYIKGNTGLWEVVIGLEIHAQIISNAKLFSGAATAFGAEPNTQVSFVDAGFPGMLPVINRECVRQAIKTGLGLNAEINKFSVFDRKNYFYPDLPQGYQISQFAKPIVGKGVLEVDLEGDISKKIAITRLHLEQDAGKSIHDQRPNETFIDLNRSGVALMEIVTEPEIRSAEEAQAFVKKLRALLRYLGTCDGNMEQGSMRCDVNISVRRVGETAFGTRAEIKNVNSIRFIGLAIEHEIQRQIGILEDGGVIDQETRLFDATTGNTRSMRSKEDAYDYRYFPDPDLPPLNLTDEEIEAIKNELPELPDIKKERYKSIFDLPHYDAAILSNEFETAQYFEQALNASKILHTSGMESAQSKKYIKLVANWIIGELFASLNKESLPIAQSKVTAAHLAELVDLIADDTISGKIAKDVFQDMWSSGLSPAKIVQDKGLQQVSDDGAIIAHIETILKNHPEQVAEYKSGKDKVFGFFVGKVMKETQGKANPSLVNDLLKKKLQE
ncbi:MAG: Asp-tRNA(Asn)/Glu-tRNA(Gln) amidotransferase subunit GatB [Candidatus Nucleicultricaceae bacterium]